MFKGVVVFTPARSGRELPARTILKYGMDKILGSGVRPPQPRAIPEIKGKGED